MRSLILVLVLITNSGYAIESLPESAGSCATTIGRIQELHKTNFELKKFKKTNSGSLIMITGNTDANSSLDITLKYSQRTDSCYFLSLSRSSRSAKNAPLETVYNKDQCEFVLRNNLNSSKSKSGYKQNIFDCNIAIISEFINN